MSNRYIIIKKANVAVKDGYTLIEIPVCYGGNEKMIRAEGFIPVKNFVPGSIGDAAVALVLIFAIRNSLDIQSEMPLSNELLYQINDYLSPVLSRAGKLRRISLEETGEKDQKKLIQEENGQQFIPEKSGGALDLSYGQYGMITLRKHMNDPEYSKFDYVITATNEKETADFHGLMDDSGIKTIIIKNNASELFKYSREEAALCSSLSYAQLFSTIAAHYYIPAETFIDDYCVDINDFQKAELMMAECFSTSRVSIAVEDLEICRDPK